MTSAHPHPAAANGRPDLDTPNRNESEPIDYERTQRGDRLLVEATGVNPGRPALVTVRERLTRSIADVLADEVDAEAVLVEIAATHLCDAVRSVEATATATATRTAVGTSTDAEQRRFRHATQRTEK